MLFMNATKFSKKFLSSSLSSSKYGAEKNAQMGLTFFMILLNRFYLITGVLAGSEF